MVSCCLRQKWKSVATMLFFLGILAGAVMNWSTLPTQKSMISNSAKGWDAGRAAHADTGAATTTTKTKKKPRGVFILKVRKAQDACKTVCTLSHFFNKEAGYPIRIFADEPVSDQQMEQLRNSSGGVGADIQVIVDTQRWRQIPSILNKTERELVIQGCINLDKPDVATCTAMNVHIGYIYMGYWRYMHMADEPSLQEFDYFVSLDADSFLTQSPSHDPFDLMDTNNLNGFFNILAFQSGVMINGIQEAAEAVVPSLDERKDRYLDHPNYTFMDDKGPWTSHYWSIWGCFYGGRLDFFRTSQFKKFARTVAPFTYRFRTDEQPVIAVAWSLLGDGNKVWYLPMHDGIEMGVFHHGWVDNKEIVRRDVTPPEDQKHLYDDMLRRNQSYWRHTLNRTWDGFQELRMGKLMKVEDYTKTLGYTDDWEKCWLEPTK